MLSGATTCLMLLASTGGLAACGTDASEPTSSKPTPPPPAAVAAQPNAVREDDASTARRLVRVPAGTYAIGSVDGPGDERPRHSVRVRGFSIERFPITNAQVAAWLNRRGSSVRQRADLVRAGAPESGTRGEPDAWVDARGRPLFETNDVDDDSGIVHENGRFAAERGTGRNAVVEITWEGARRFCIDRGGRLPTEVEWEAAARGRSGRAYPWGDAAPDSERAQFDRAWGDIAPVDGHPRGATPDGIQDMAGNVYEWTSSLYRPYPYRADDGRETPRGLADRSTKGGAHDNSAGQLRAAYRSRDLSRAPELGHHNIGARCAADS